MERLLKRMVARDRGGADGTGCPDADVLAAFVDGELTDGERRAVEAHAAGCQRCADILALTVTTAEDPATAATLAHVATVDRWRRAYWTVPLATAATVAALWVATSREAIAPRETTLTAGRQETAVSQPQGASPSQAAAPAPSPAQPPVAPEQSGPADARAGGFQDAGRPGRTPPAAAAEAGQEVPDLRDEVRTREQEPPPAPAAPETMPSQPGVLEERGAVASLRQLTGTSLLVRSPGGRTSWRVTNGFIERTEDAGMTWVQEFRAAGVLTVGMAISDEVAWLAGAQGLVLRRTQAGWTVVTAPANDAVTALRATSAEEATVTIATGRMLMTIDGGATWR